MRDGVRNPEILPPDPLILRLWDVIPKLPVLTFSPGHGLTTGGKTANRFFTALTDLYDGNTWECREHADKQLSYMINEVSNSTSHREIYLVLFSRSKTMRVYTAGKPYGVVDERIFEELPILPIIKEPLKDGKPDYERVTRNANAAAVLWHYGRAHPDFPLTEMTARTNRRIIGARTGRNLLYECTGEEALAQLPKIEEEDDALAEFYAATFGMPKKLDYKSYVRENGFALSHLFEGRLRREYEKAVAHDALLARRITRGRTFEPKTDTTAVNILIEPDGRRRYIDSNTALDIAITSYHRRAYRACDPKYPLPMEERARRMGDGVADAFLHMLHRPRRALDGKLFAPLPEWIPAVEQKYDGYFEQLLYFGELVEPEFHTPRFHRMINFAAYRGQATTDAVSSSRH